MTGLASKTLSWLVMPVLLLSGCRSMSLCGQKPVSLYIFNSDEIENATDESLSKEYGNLTNRIDKLLFCMSVVESRKMTTLTNVSSIGKIFGSDFVDYGFDKDGASGTAVVHFSDWIYFPNGASPVRQGWYLAIYYDKGGRIYRYFLSNIQNSPHMWGF